ncbi:MAG: tetratricopeptide repeat protein [Gloeobacterales cyanobacterium]
MVKQRPPKRESIRSSPPLLSQNSFQTQLQSLLKQQKYRQALEEIHKAQRSQPDLTITPSEAEIWLLRGKQDFQKANFKQAEAALRRTLQLGLRGEAHYWLAKCLLAMNRLDDAIALIRPAFEDGSLPKEYSICYPKLLLLKGDTTATEELLSKHSKRFPAAQQHWLQGVLSLKAQQPEAALASFQKVKHPLTPGDRPIIWQIYTQQALHNWEVSALQLGLGLQTATRWGFSLRQPAYTEHPILQRLALLQHIKTGNPPLEQMHFKGNGQVPGEAVDVITILELIDENNPHDAAHILLKLDRRSTKFPELATLRPTLLTLAGQQALTQGEEGCAAEFWQVVQREQPFNPQLAVNLVKVLDANGDYQELQQLLTRLIKWLEQSFKQHPQDWPEDRRKITLAYGHCRLADTWMAMGRMQAGMGELRTAERIHPQSPEVKGRHGLAAVMEKRYEEATQLLTQALEEGCWYREVYTTLIDTWKKLGNSEAALEARRRFGKKFGDLSPETDVEVLPWVDALSTRKYSFFSPLVQGGSSRDPAMRACQIFVEAAQGEPTPGGKVTLNQGQATQRWTELLEGLSPKEQVPTLQAIVLSLLLFVKQEKGIVALITQYMSKLFDLGAQQPEAREAHLVVLALKERDLKKLQAPLQAYLMTMPQPGNALAQLQLQLRRYTQTIPQNQVLRSFIDEALQREPQNSLLLLAKATTYPVNSASYEEFKQQGFEIARRLQDAKSLQAFRKEQAFLDAQEVQQFLPAPADFDNFDMSDMENLLEGMIRKMFGSKIPPAELKRMLPELKQMMLNNMPDFEEEDDDFGFGFGFPQRGFSPAPPKRSKRPKRRRR